MCDDRPQHMLAAKRQAVELCWALKFARATAATRTPGADDVVLDEYGELLVDAGLAFGELTEAIDGVQRQKMTADAALRNFRDVVGLAAVGLLTELPEEDEDSYDLFVLSQLIDNEVGVLRQRVEDVLERADDLRVAVGWVADVLLEESRLRDLLEQELNSRLVEHRRRRHSLTVRSSCHTNEDHMDCPVVDAQLPVGCPLVGAGDVSRCRWSGCSGDHHGCSHEHRFEDGGTEQEATGGGGGGGGAIGISVTDVSKKENE